jgi:hypothetical protein
MYQHKKNLAHCETDIHEVKSALADLLQNDEDMAAMYLTIKAATGYFSYPFLSFIFIVFPSFFFFGSSIAQHLAMNLRFPLLGIPDAKTNMRKSKPSSKTTCVRSSKWKAPSATCASRSR